MENLNDLVRRKIDSKIAAGYKSADHAINTLTAEGKIAKDFIHRVGSSRYGNLTPLMIFMASQSGVQVELKNYHLEKLGEYSLTNHALQQAGLKLGIPTPYLASLGLSKKNEWSRELAAHILNEHSKWTDKKRVLVRTVGDQVRGILSDSYRRIDSQMILKAHVEEAYRQGAVVSKGYIDQTRVYIETLMPEPIKIETERNGVIYLAFGNRWQTSDYGDGALEGRSFIMQGVCLNGLVRESVLRTVHLGAKLPDNLALSEETYRLDSLTQRSAVIDITKQLYSRELITERLGEIKLATDIVVDPERELDNLKGKLLKGESEEIGKVLMRNNPLEGVQGESTIWKLSQSISSFANNEDVTERRRFELQEIAGELFDRVK